MVKLELNGISECDKMFAVKKESQIIGEFLNSMQSNGIRLCRWTERKPVCGFREDEDDHDHDEGCYNLEADGFVPVRQSIEQILADYFHIDLKKVESEKQKILDDIRSGKK